jgi:hypothetical protein
MGKSIINEHLSLILNLLRKGINVFFNVFVKRPKKKRYIKNLIKEVSLFLEKGQYYIDPNLKYVYRNDEITKYILMDTFGYESLWKIKKKLQLRIIDKYTCVNNNISYSFDEYRLPDFKGTFLLLSNKQEWEENYGDFKIFDFANKKILTKHVNHFNYGKKIDTYKIFCPFFNIPSIIYFGESQNITIEKMVDIIPYKYWKEKEYNIAANYILTAYFYYFKGIKDPLKLSLVQPENFFSKIALTPKALVGLNKIRDNIGPNLLKINLPLVFQNGDLSISNVLISKKENCFIIDWEHANHFTFLYDIMWPWQNEAIYHNNYFFINEYYKGEYDVALNKIFTIFNLSFNHLQRHNYFNIVVAEILYRRILIKGSIIASSFISDKIMPMINNIENHR